jgi:hypothetical protein
MYCNQPHATIFVRDGVWCGGRTLFVVCYCAAAAIAGHMYSVGYGCKPDTEQASKWFAEASKRLGYNVLTDQPPLMSSIGPPQLQQQAAGAAAGSSGNGNSSSRSQQRLLQGSSSAGGCAGAGNSSGAGGLVGTLTPPPPAVVATRAPTAQC